MKKYCTSDCVIALNIMLTSYCERSGYELDIAKTDRYQIRHTFIDLPNSMAYSHYLCTEDLENQDVHFILTSIVNQVEKEFDKIARERSRQKVYVSTAGVRSGRYPWSDVFAAYCKADVEVTKRMAKFFDPDKTPEIKDVIFQDPATIVLWADGTKTVVRAQDEEYDPEKGLAMAICKKIGGNKWSYFNKFKHWLKKIKPTTGDFEQVSHTTKVIKED